MLVWCITHFGTLFICMKRLIKIQNALRKLVLHPKWEKSFEKQCGNAKETAIRFRTLVEDWSFFANMQKAVELTEPVYAHLWICDTDIYNTIGTVYDFWLKIQGCVKKWERTEFSKVDGVAAFRPTYCSLVGNQTHKDNGKKANHGFTAEEMVSFWWTKMAEAGNTNRAHVLRRWLNPACFGESSTAMIRFFLLGRDLVTTSQTTQAWQGKYGHSTRSTGTWTQRVSCSTTSTVRRSAPMILRSQITPVPAQIGGLSWIIHMTQKLAT